MSWLDLLTKGLGALGRMVGVRAGPDVAPLPLRHWVPPHNTTQAWSAGPGRCYYCLAHELTQAFDKPCPRKRPPSVELA
jgi:hypothetical protein